MAEHGGELSSKAVASMPYAEAVTKEAMRLSPIVGLIFRVALKTFEVGGYTIPKARTVSSHVWRLNMAVMKTNSMARLRSGTSFVK